MSCSSSSSNDVDGGVRPGARAVPSDDVRAVRRGYGARVGRRQLRQPVPRGALRRADVQDKEPGAGQGVA